MTTHTPGLTIYRRCVYNIPHVHMFSLRMGWSAKGTASLPPMCRTTYRTMADSQSRQTQGAEVSIRQTIPAGTPRRIPGEKTPLLSSENSTTRMATTRGMATEWNRDEARS